MRRLEALKSARGAVTTACRFPVAQAALVAGSSLAVSLRGAHRKQMPARTRCADALVFHWVLAFASFLVKVESPFG